MVQSCSHCKANALYTNDKVPLCCLVGASTLNLNNCQILLLAPTSGANKSCYPSTSLLAQPSVYKLNCALCQSIIINKININKYYNYISTQIPDIAYHDNYFSDENITISILSHILSLDFIASLVFDIVLYCYQTLSSYHCCYNYNY